MKGYSVTAVGGEPAGTVAAVDGDRIIVRQGGFLHRTSRVVPSSLAEVDHDARMVRTTLPLALLESAPLEGSPEHDVEAHFGLRQGYSDPALRDDPELQQDSPQHPHAQPALGAHQGPNDHPSSPALLGDRGDSAN